MDTIPATEDRQDIDAQILTVFDRTRDTFEYLVKTGEKLTPETLRKFADSSKLDTVINLRGSSSGGYLRSKLDTFANAGLDRTSYLQQLNASYPGIVAAGFFHRTGEYADGWAHFHTGAQNPGGETLKAPDGSEVVVTHKTYFSLRTEGNMGVKNIDRFIRHLPQVARQIADVAKKHGATIAFKIPSKLEEMLLIRDTLVIHSDTPACLPELHSAITKLLTESDKPVELERDERGHYGFDFRCSNPAYDGSYSQLLTRALFGRLAAAAAKRPDLLDPNRTGDFKDSFLKPCLRLTADWAPERMIAQLASPFKKSLEERT